MAEAELRSAHSREQERLLAILETSPDFISTVMREQREAESTLRRAEERYRAMTENVPGVMYQFQTWPDGRVAFPFISHGIERMYGVPPEQWRSEPSWALDAILDEDRPAYESAFRDAAARMGTFLWEGRTRTARDGEMLWIRCQSQPSLQTDGSILWDGLVTDTTALHLQAAEQARQAAFQKSLLQCAEVAIISTDLNGTVTSFNTHAEALLGWKAPEVIGKATPALWHDPEEVARRAEELSEVYGRAFPGYEVFSHLPRIGGTEQRQWTFLTRDGCRIPMLLTVSGIRDASDRLVGFLGVGADLRELKAREVALEASERQFRDLVASVPGIVFQSRPLPGGRREFTFVSDYCRVILGLDPAEAMANPQWLEGMVLPEDRASLAQAVASARESNGATEWVGRMRRKPDGQIRWVRLQATPWQAADGSFRWNGLVMDLTERIDSELALRQSEERLALVLKGSNDAPWDWDLERGDLYYSPRWWHMLGYADNELHVDTDLWKLMTHPDDQSHVVAALDEALQGGGDSYEVEFRLRHKEGHFVPVLSRGFIQRNEAGLPVRISGTNMDLTERKSVEESLVASQARSQALLEAMPDLIFLVHRDGTHLEVHAHSEGGLRRPKAQILGKNMRDIYPPDIYEERMARIQRVLATGVPESYETRFQALGGLQDHESRVVPCGRDTVLVIARDITERKALERLKNDFISTVSHELRTPLTSIKGALGLMAGGVAGTLPPQALDLARMALENANRLARLIDDLLDLAKTESAELSLDLRVHDLRRLADRAIEGIAGFAQAHRVTLAPAWEAEAAPARVDGDRLIQVVLNLLSNAVKYSASGATVEVRLRRLDHAWRLEVENHGPEIPEAFRARIFQKFAMADGSDTRSRGGTGLGLAISKALVERMGGTIDYRSGSGRTLFYVELPRAEETP